jgi:acyl dehydratase
MELMRDSVPISKAHLDAGLIKPQENDNSVTRPLVHGMLVSSLFSSIFAGLVPGSIYINQTLQFATPVFVDDVIVGRVEIEKIRRWRKGGIVVQCDTHVFSRLEKIQLIKGTANVWLPEGYEA